MSIRSLVDFESQWGSKKLSSSNMDQEHYISLLQRVKKRDVLLHCLFMTTCFSHESFQKIRNRVRCIHFHLVKPLPTLVHHGMIDFIKCMIDIGLNPYYFSHFGYKTMHNLSNWSAQNNTSLPLWLRDSILTTLCIIRRFPMAIRAAIVQMIVIGVATDYFHGKQVSYGPPKKRIKLAESKSTLEFMKMKPAYHAEETVHWKTRALIAWSVCDARFFTGQTQNWESFLEKLIDVSFCKRICELLDFRQISTDLIYKTYVYGKDPIEAGYLLIRASKKQNRWNCVQKMLVRPNFARIYPQLQIASIQAGLFWHSQIMPTFDTWNQAWFHWNWENHQNQLLYTTQFRLQADVILDSTLPQRCAELICFYLARYYKLINGCNPWINMSHVAIEKYLANRIHPHFKNKIPHVGLHQEEFSRLARRVLAENELFMWYTGLILLDVFLFWKASAIITHWLGLNAWLSWLRLEMEYAWVPHELAELTERSIVLILLTISYYLLPNLPRANWFRHAAIWDWLRLHHTRVEIYCDGGDVLPHLKEGKPVMYACAPHSMYGEHLIMGMVLNPLFSNVRVICTSLLFWIPISRECTALADCAPATMPQIMSNLNSGHDIALIPEGMRGVLQDTSSILPTRQGFIRAALTAKNGCRLVPVYVHGTESHYWVWNPWPWFQKRMLTRFMYPWPIIHFGHWGSFWPRPSTLRFRVGKPLEAGPNETVESLSKRFCEEMDKLKLIQ